MTNIPGLSPRQNEIANLLAEGLSNKEIARRLAVSLSHVKSQTHLIFVKTSCPNRASFISRYNERDIGDQNAYWLWESQKLIHNLLGLLSRGKSEAAQEEIKKYWDRWRDKPSQGPASSSAQSTSDSSSEENSSQSLP